MYTVLTKEIADVDKGLFRKIGRFPGDVKALPVTAQIFAVKSIRPTEVDSEVDSQNSFFITVDVYGPGEQHPDWKDEWMKPGILYEHKKQQFVELRYDYPLGLVNLTIYFLVPLESCEFYLKNDRDLYQAVTIDDLEELEHFVWVA